MVSHRYRLRLGCALQHIFLIMTLDLMCILSNFVFKLYSMRLSACQSWVGSLKSGIIHFLKVTDSYWTGLFHCYSVSGLPRTNNDLELIFGIVCHHQRRCTLAQSYSGFNGVTRQCSGALPVLPLNFGLFMLSSWLLFQSPNGASYVLG